MTYSTRDVQLDLSVMNGRPGCHDIYVGIDENIPCLNDSVSRKIIMHKNDSWTMLLKGKATHVALRPH